jgi:hypothetical protein
VIDSLLRSADTAFFASFKLCGELTYDVVVDWSHSTRLTFSLTLCFDFCNQAMESNALNIKFKRFGVK